MTEVIGAVLLYLPSYLFIFDFDEQLVVALEGFLIELVNLNEAGPVSKSFLYEETHLTSELCGLHVFFLKI